MADVPGVFRKFFSDPWFTSLWTLQESVLRKDAIIFARDGSTIPYGHFQDGERKLFYLPHLSVQCSDIYDYTIPEEKIDDPLIQKVNEVFSELRPLVIKAGIKFLSARNPNVQYGAPSFRETKYPLDRIYGIM